ncbi:hypothetical protein [Kaarinaea lacus]
MADNQYRHTTNYPVDFSLSFSQVNLDLDSNGRTYSIYQRRISAALFHINSPSLRSGINLGSTYIDLDDDSATSEFGFNGNHIGITVMGSKGNNPRFGISAQYLYQELTGENSQRTATLSWLEWHTEASLEFDLGPYWTINTGIGLVGIDARRKVSGDINNTLKLKESSAFQGRVRFDLNTYPDGRISLVLNRGMNTGTMLVFARGF